MDQELKTKISIILFKWKYMQHVNLHFLFIILIIRFDNKSEVIQLMMDLYNVIRLKMDEVKIVLLFKDIIELQN